MQRLFREKNFNAEKAKEYIMEPAAPQERRLVDSKTEFIPPPGFTPLPLRDDNQQFILLNIAHQSHRPRSKFPGFRILGAFPDMESISAHVAQNFQNSDCSLFATPAHQLMSICSSTERQQDLEFNRRHIDELVQLHKEVADQRDLDFKRNVEEKKTGSVGQSLFAKQSQAPRISEAAEKKFEDAMIGLKKTSTLTAASCLPKQNFAAVIFLSDIRQSEEEILKEPLIAVLAVFSTEEDTINYAKYTASRNYPKCDINVIDLYAWCFPENIDVNQIKEVYGNEQLNSIMQGRKENMEQSKRFATWCTENKVEPNIIEIGEELVNPPSVTEQLMARQTISVTENVE